MKKVVLILIMLLSFSFVYAEGLEQEYIDIVETETFTVEDLREFQETYDNQALSMFLTAHVALADYEYAVAYENLEKALALTESDTLRIEILYYLSEIDFLFNDWSRMILRGLDLKELAHTNDNLKGVIRADQIIALGYLRNLEYNEAEKYSDEALNLSKSIGYQLGELKYYFIKGDIAYYQDDYDVAIDWYEQAEAYYKKHKLVSYFEDLNYVVEKNIAWCLIFQNRQLNAVERLEPLLDLIPEENALQQAKMNYILGYATPQFEKSLNYLHSALDAYEVVPMNDRYPRMKYKIQERLAQVNYSVGEYKKAADGYHDVNNYYSSSEYTDSTYASYEDLGEFRYNEVTEKIALLEELAEIRAAELSAQKKLLLIIVGSVVLLTISGLVIIIVLKLRKKSQDALYINSIIDPLTDVYNRRRIIELFESNLEGNNAVVLLDMDNLKDVNETYGHIVGDEVLKNVADILKQSVRGNDVVGRLGGGEFLMILDAASQEECRIVGERIRQNVEDLDWAHEGLITTCSVGVTRIYSKNPDEVLGYVSELVQQAKGNGKNQVVYG